MSEGLAVFNVLQTRGVPSKLVMFPDENHVSAIMYAENAQRTVC